MCKSWLIIFVCWYDSISSTYTCESVSLSVTDTHKLSLCWCFWTLSPGGPNSAGGPNSPGGPGGPNSPDCPGCPGCPNGPSNPAGQFKFSKKLDLLAVLTFSFDSPSSRSNSIIQQFYCLAIASKELCELVKHTRTFPGAYNRPDPSVILLNFHSLRDLWPLRHLNRVMIRHDLTQQIIFKKNPIYFRNLKLFQKSKMFPKIQFLSSTNLNLLKLCNFILYEQVFGRKRLIS